MWTVRLETWLDDEGNFIQVTHTTGVALYERLNFYVVDIFISTAVVADTKPSRLNLNMYVIGFLNILIAKSTTSFIVDLWEPKILKILIFC